VTTLPNDNCKFYSENIVGGLDNKVSELGKYLCLLRKNIEIKDRFYLGESD